MPASPRRPSFRGTLVVLLMLLAGTAAAAAAYYYWTHFVTIGVSTPDDAR